MPRTRLALVGCLLLAASALGCSSDDQDDAGSPAPSSGTSTGSSSASASAAVGPAARHRAQCIVADRQQEFMVQPGTVNPDGDLTLTSVSLRAPVNVSVIDAWVVPFKGSAAAHGTIMNYPPNRHAGIADGLAEWGDRQVLAGRQLTAADGRQAVLLALRLTDPAAAGHLDGVTLASSAGDTAWTRPLLVEPHRSMRFCTIAEFDSTLDWVP